MSHFIVSARKYRPTTFDDVISQPHITHTLKNAIRAGKLAQAFLFCGPRGVGKTTCARILAKVLNCKQVAKDTAPCNTCTSCTSFNKNSAMNVYELDAASNNSVEDIRDLVEQVRYAPQIGSYKIYIIDEVHMLSNAAFNAFLKTLEEPPSYAIFILATTERQKIIPTILSRCQIFNFQRIQPQDIVTQLKRIASQESISYQEEALHVISQKSEGSMRDALSIFDLIVAAAGYGNQLTYQAAIANLQVLDQAYYFKLVEAFLRGDIGTSLVLYNEVVRAGFDSHYFIVGLGEHLRNLLVCHNKATIELIEATDYIKVQYQMQVEHITVTCLLQALQVLNQCDIHYKSSKNQRLHVELALIHIASLLQHQESLTDNPIVPTQPISPPIAPSKPKGATLVQQTTTLLPTKSAKSNRQPPQHVQETIQIPHINQLKKKHHKVTATPENKIISAEGPQMTFSMEQLQVIWDAYTSDLKREQDIAIYNILNQDIQLEGTTIMLNLVNPIQQDILAHAKPTLLQKLRTALQNRNIDIKGNLAQSDTVKKPYTEEEKLQYLAKKNKQFSLLQKELALTVTFH